MKVIVFANRKGGVGKTTLACTLGVAAQASSTSPVALIDTDPQASLTDWWNARKADTPTLVTVDVTQLQASLRDLAAKKYSYAFIDTQGATTGVVARAIKTADLVVIPTRPSSVDLRAMSATVDMVGDKPCVFVINGAANRARITGEMAIALSQYGTVCPVHLFQRTDVAECMLQGLAVQELDPDGKSATEVKAMWEYIKDRIKKGAR
jgi:chromosome partitioning protein